MRNINGILLDIDNTLYDYSVCHEYAMQKCTQWVYKNHGIDELTFTKSFNISRKTINMRLENTAASHNRLLYFQLTLEKLKITSFINTLELYNCYWDNFLDIITPFEGINYIFEKYIGKVCFVTDLTAHIQHRKIEKLNLAKYENFIVTSEEAGCEKPNKKIFKIALDKLNLDPNSVCVIGDNFEKDIIGAKNLNLQSIWLNRDKTNQHIIPNGCIEIKEINEIKRYI